MRAWRFYKVAVDPIDPAEQKSSDDEWAGRGCVLTFARHTRALSSGKEGTKSTIR
jgi:hypothetical protein